MLTRFNRLVVLFSFSLFLVLLDAKRVVRSAESRIDFFVVVVGFCSATSSSSSSSRDVCPAWRAGFVLFCLRDREAIIAVVGIVVVGIVVGIVSVVSSLCVQIPLLLEILPESA